MKNSKFVIILLGPSGSGKGTQARLLAKKFNIDYVGSGHLLRQRGKSSDYTGRKITETIGSGSLAPTAIIFKLWVDRFEKMKKNFRGFVMDGCPRKIMEAHLVDEMLQWYGWDKNVKVFWVDISREQSIERLLKREGNRSEDNISGIKKRLSWFKTEVLPTIRYYQKTRGVNKINGEQSVEKVFQDILRYLK